MIRTNAIVEREHMTRYNKELMLWLHPTDSSISFNSARSKHQPGTGLWLFEHPSFQRFQAGEATRNFLWLYGIPGCGKTILSSTVIVHLCHTKPDCAILQFFFDFRDSSQQSVDQLIRSVIAQLFNKAQNSQVHLITLYEEHKHSTPSTETLFLVFHKMVLSASKVYMVIDAMDECLAKPALITCLENICISTSGKLSVIATSRPEADLESQIRRWADKEYFISLQQKVVDSDIAAHVRARLHATNGGFRRWHLHPWVLEEIEAKFTKQAAGM